MDLLINDYNIRIGDGKSTELPLSIFILWVNITL